MKIGNIFTKEISRPINGVVMADQLTEAIVWQELDEYVVTKELNQHFRKFLNAYLSAIDLPHDPVITGRMGIWVSGFFGSGKSHFIKILSYLIGNRQAHDAKTKTEKKAIDFFADKIKDPMLLADLKRIGRRDTDVILFNIDSRADASEGRSTILSVFWRVFNEMQGFCAHSLQLAEIEYYLAKKGKFEEFRQAFNNIYGSSWEKERDAYSLLKDEIVEALSKVLDKSKQAAEEWFENIEAHFNLTVEGFATRVKEYLDSKGPEHKIIFLVDEVGQFIGNDTHLMLNLQTIVEDLGRVCQGRAGVVVTSQEDIDAVLRDLRAARANDFSKIQGRFNTRLSLSSTNTDEVIQARLLEKTDIAKAELKSLFNQKGDILKNQLGFTQDSATLKNYTDTDNFVQNYPFVPYHFQLVQKIFDSIRKTGFTGLHLSRGERSMLDAFQSSAINVSSKPIGALVPLHEFYPCIESFLDTSVKRSIDQAQENTGLEIPFDIEILQTLFLIRHVDSIKPNVDNLVTLRIDEADADRIKLKKAIEGALVRLERQNLISRNGDLYFFLTNEEQEVSQEIKSMDIAPGQDTELVSELLFGEILKLKTKHRYAPYNKDYPINRICDGKPYKSKGDYDLAVEFITPLHDEYNLFGDQKCIMHSTSFDNHVIVKLPVHEQLAGEIRAFLQTDKYIGKKSDAAASDTLKRILRDRADENRLRKERLVSKLDELAANGNYYALMKKLEIKATKTTAAIDEALDYLVLNIFSKFNFLSTGFHDNPHNEIKQVLLADDIGQEQLRLDLEQSEPQDIKEIRTYIDLMTARSQQVIMGDLVSYFSKRPYGWPEWEVVILTAKMFMAGIINLVIEGEKIKPKAAIDPLSKTPKWKTVKIFKRKITGKADLQKAQNLGKELFGDIGPDIQDKLVGFLKQGLMNWNKDLDTYRILADTGNYPGKKEAQTGLALTSKLLSIHDTYEFIKAFNDNKDKLLDACNDYQDLTDFHTHQIQTWKSLLSAVDAFKPNQAVLEKNPEAAEKLGRMYEILASPAPYSMLKEVNGLIAGVKAVNDERVEKNRLSASGEIDAIIDQAKKLLDESQAKDDLRNQALYPLQEIRKKIESEISIPHMAFRINEAREQYEAIFDLIEESKPALELKKIRTIKPAALASKTYLENEQDVDEFLSKIRKALLAALKEDQKIRII
ncbi:MAG: BREX system P-loop protein BrxC [Pseudomonadota bacterium]